MLPAFLLLLPPRSTGQSPSPNVFVYSGVRIAAVSGPGNGLDSGFGVSVPLARRTRIGFSLSLNRQPFASGNRPDLLSRDLGAAPLYIYVQHEILAGKRFSTYASIGAGIQFSGLRDFGPASLPGATASRSLAPGIIMRAAGGISVAVLTHVRLFAEGAYLSGRATGRTRTIFLRRLVQEKHFHFDWNAVQVGLGIQYLF